jgi:hypothetical protein
MTMKVAIKEEIETSTKIRVIITRIIDLITTIKMIEIEIITIIDSSRYKSSLLRD